MALTVVTEPAVEPVSLDEAKCHLRVTVTEDDVLIEGLMRAAREQIELECSRALIKQTLELALDAFPHCNWLLSPTWAIAIPRPPLISVTSITYTDVDGNAQILATSEYTVDTRREPAVIVPAWGKAWPSTREVPNAVVVRYVAGYGDDPALVPEALKLAAKMLIGHWYDNRESVVIGQGLTPATVPMAVDRLLMPHRILPI